MTGASALAAREILALLGAATLSWLIMLGLTFLLGDALMTAWHWAAPHLPALAPAR